MKPKDSVETRSLQAVIEFVYDREQFAKLAVDFPVAGMINFEVPSSQTMQLRVTPSSWQIDLDGPTLYGSGMTLIRHRDGSAEYHDHGTRTRLTMSAGEVPPATVRRPGQWKVTDPGTRDPDHNPNWIEVSLEDPLTRERWIQRIRTGVHCDDLEILTSFVEALLAGGTAQATSQYPVEQVSALFAKRGLPEEISLYAEGSDAMLSCMKITYVDADQAQQAKLHRGAGYRDLRDPKNRKAWSKPGPGLREVSPRDLDELRILNEDTGGRGGVATRMLPGGRPDQDPPDPPAPFDNSPAPVITTNAAQVALRIEQRLLDDIQRAVNAVAAHITGASTNGTDLVIPWLEDLVKSSRQLDPPDANGVRLKNVDGTGLAALLHEDPGAGVVKRCLPGGGRGIIDRKAATLAAEYMLAGAVPGHVLMALSPAEASAITTAFLLPAASRFGSLSAAVAVHLITAVAFDDIGTLRFSLSKLRDRINIKDLYWVQLTNFSLSMALPLATMSSSVPPAPLEAPLLNGLRCRSGGSIEGSISILSLGVDATILRTPTPLYWALLIAGTPLIPIIFPQFAWVIPILWSLSLFLATDFARLRLDARPLTAAMSVRFLSNATSPALRPRVSLQMGGTIRTRMLSYVPTGIHQLVDWAVAGFFNLFGATLSILEGQLAAVLQAVLDEVMGDGVPGSILRLGVPVASGKAFGEDDKYVYLESTFGTPTDPSIRITPTPVSAALRYDLQRDITRDFGTTGSGGRGRHYLSLAGSINAVNQVAAVLWKRGEFNQSFPGSSLAAIRPLLTAPFSGQVVHVNAYQFAPPVFSLLPGGPSSPIHSFDVVFPAFVVMINHNSTHSWEFRCRVTARGVFGLGAVPPGHNFLSIAGIRTNIFEPMLDLTSVTTTLLEATEIELTTITVKEAGQDPRHPQVIHTHQETVENTTDHTQNAPSGWTLYARNVFILGSAVRDAGHVPYLDQRKSNGSGSTWPLDAVSQQTYGVDGVDPDDATAAIPGIPIAPYAQLPVDWGYVQGLSFAHIEVSGALQQLLSGAHHLNSFQIVDAEFMYPFLEKLPF